MNALSYALYMEIDITCILLLAYVLIKSVNYVEKRESWFFFQLAVFFILLFVLSDLVWCWLENSSFSIPVKAAYLVNASYFIFCIMGIASWFFYTECELGTRVGGTKPFLVVAAVPLILTISIQILNLYNQCLFYFDDNGVYHRGKWNVSAFLIPCIYLGYCVIHTLRVAFRKENYVKRRSYLNLAAFALPTTVASVLQIVIVGTPLPCIGFSASVLSVYMTSQELLISVDPLTKINNRNDMIRYLGSRMEHHDVRNHLYLFLLDLDHFKQVNDTYGHIEGDHALLRFAEVLKQTAAVFGCFAARYGGDKFILIFETSDESKVQQLCDFVHARLEASNETARKGYGLTASIGWAEYEESIRYVPEFIERADQALYEIKQKRPPMEP